MPLNYIQSLNPYLTSMDTKIYPVNIKLFFKAVNAPDCRILIGGKIQDLIISQDTWINLSLEAIGPQTLTIEHRNKKDSDPNTALIIEQIQFNEILSPKFIWAGTYYPTYPNHMSGPNELKAHNYLSWNGVWQLEFTLPIYTWIHETLNLGWIYD